MNAAESASAASTSAAAAEEARRTEEVKRLHKQLIDIPEEEADKREKGYDKDEVRCFDFLVLHMTVTLGEDSHDLDRWCTEKWRCKGCPQYPVSLATIKFIEAIRLGIATAEHWAYLTYDELDGGQSYCPPRRHYPFSGWKKVMSVGHRKNISTGEDQYTMELDMGISRDEMFELFRDDWATITVIGYTGRNGPGLLASANGFICDGDIFPIPNCISLSPHHCTCRYTDEGFPGGRVYLDAEEYEVPEVNQYGKKSERPDWHKEEVAEEMGIEIEEASDGEDNDEEDEKRSSQEEEEKKKNVKIIITAVVGPNACKHCKKHA